MADGSSAQQLSPDKVLMLEAKQSIDQVQSPESGKLAGLLIQKAVDKSKDPTTSAHGIIDGLIDYAIHEMNLLGGEFLQIFEEHNLAEIIVDNFTATIKRHGRQFEFDEKVLRQARKELQVFLKQKFVKGQVTISTFLRDGFSKSPNMELRMLQGEALKSLQSQLFDFGNEKNQSTKDLLLDGISTIAEQKVSESFRNSFEKDPKEFIDGHILPRFLKVNGNGRIDINPKNAELVVKFLEEQGYASEQLYLQMIKWLRVEARTKAQNIAYRQKMGIRASVDAAIPQIVTAIENPEEEVLKYFHIIWLRRVATTISAYKESLLEFNGKKIDWSNITDTSPAGFRQTVAPPKAKQYLYELASLVERAYEGEEEAAKLVEHYLRDHFNTPGVDNTVENTYEEFLKDLGEELGHVKEIIEKLIESALDLREANDPIREDYRFIDEIIDCRDPRKLIQWLGNPQSFTRELEETNPERLRFLQGKYGMALHSLVVHYARNMFYSSILYRRFAYEYDFKNAESHQHKLEEHFLDALQIDREAIRIDKITFAAAQEIDAQGNPIEDENGKISTVYFHDRMTPDEVAAVKSSGKHYAITGLENGYFMVAKSNHPDFANEGNGELMFYISHKDYEDYIQNKFNRDYPHFINIKKLASIFSTYWRKAGADEAFEIPDKLRAAVTSCNTNIPGEMTSWLLRCNGAVMPPTRVIDKEKGIDEKIGGDKHRSNSFSKDGKHGQLSGVYVTKKKEHLPFEMQVYTLQNIFAWLSEHTDTAHNVYKAKEEFQKIAAEFLFPSELGFQPFVQHALDGYAGPNKKKPEKKQFSAAQLIDLIFDNEGANDTTAPASQSHRTPLSETPPVSSSTVA